MAATMKFETGHTEMIHSAEFDFYGKRIATASSDRLVKIFAVTGKHARFVADLPGHEGPVWQVAWARPRHDGTLLASCSYDGKVIIWKETGKGWEVSYNKVIRTVQGAPCSVNSISWAPHTFGTRLAAATADGFVTLLTYEKEWEAFSFEAHKGGTNAVSWGPDAKTAAKGATTPASMNMRLVTGGCDNRVKIWRWAAEKKKFVQERFHNDEGKHGGWVRDVAWAPSVGLPTNIIASASEDKTVILWQEDVKTGTWHKKQVLNFSQKAWKVSWSVMGNILAVSQGDNTVSLWKQALDGTWQNLSSGSREGEKEEKKKAKS